jgi:hypothetical protein
MNLLFWVALLAAGATSATPLPADEMTPEQGIQATLKDAMDAIAARDTAVMKPLLRPYGSFTLMEENPDGTRRVMSGDWDAYLAAMKPGPERYEERLHDVDIRVDGTVADAWAPYTFFLDGNVRHCGVDHFQMVLDQGRWRIQNVTWTQRMTGCPAQ